MAPCQPVRENLALSDPVTVSYSPRRPQGARPLNAEKAVQAEQHCSAGSECNLDCNAVAGPCVQHCGSQANCDIDCHGPGNCLQRCNAGESCSLDCRTPGSCTLQCLGGARCTAYNCGGANCNLQCDGQVRDCGGGLLVCNRSCPDD
ncbi:MAG: hypothetical protein MJD61_06990 [Proteobacteria bacterium]|nr:hypothetical protein [Pseudomonadota bacterium]